MEENVLSYLFNYIKNLNISNCDVYLNKPTIVGDNEQRNKSYVVVSFPNGFDYKGAFTEATGMITIGARDVILGLPEAGEITRISNIIKAEFPILSADYSLIDYEFSSDDSDGTGWHEYYYTFQIYINPSN